ncbi:MAG: ABC transporter permease [Pseudomonadota bacterium]
MPDSAPPDSKISIESKRPKERILVLEAGRAEKNYWGDLWTYRELFAILAWRDVAVRYKQSIFGVGWAVVRPFLTMIVFTVIFGGVAGLPSESGVPYPVMVFAGMLPWFLFSTILGDASNSLVANANMISKIYYPRIITPVASSIVSLVDFMISFMLLAAMMVWFGVVPNLNILFLPGFILLAIIAGLGPAILMASLNLRYRDFRFIVPFVVQFGLYVSPVGFSSSVVPAQYQLLYNLNPVVSVIDGFRWCLLGGQNELNLQGLAVGMAVSFTILALAIHVFRSTEKTFADVA